MENALSFAVDEDVTVYIAYERQDHLYSSTIPDWLKAYDRIEGDKIVAQYFYFDVYKKDFPKGEIVLPGADAKSNNVMRNYFVMLQKQTGK
jgi:hypothetical protein